MAEEDVIKPRNFHEMELDDRILKAVAKLGWLEPTLIQERAIPLLLEGKDVLLRARTGSGKTGAFAIPVVQRILNSKQVSKEQNTKALILAPSKELCQQIHTNFMELTTKCSREICCVDISPQVDVSAQRQILVERPDIVVGTPLRALTHLKARNLNLKDSLEVLVVDEADLVFSFGYESEMKEVLSYLPRVYQAILASATLSEDVLNLKSMVLHNPVILKLQEPELAPATQLTHYHLAAEEDEKAAILYALLKLHLVRGKSIIFVNSVDRCYKKRKKDKEFGVARGIDFQFVSNIINFDFPPDVGSYIHRVGRTARGKHQGTALSFVSIRERPLMEDVEDRLRSCCSEDEKVFRAYQFKLEEVEGFRYRSKDAWRSVTRIAVREARLKEIKQEVLNCQKLKSYFVDNPRDLQSLRHDKALHTVKIQPHLADVPEYIIPPALKNLAGVSRPHKRHFPRDGGFSGTSNAKARYDAKKRNPLLCMEFSGFKKKR
ncbi:probable ATP-dependent RNA helicase DDX56 isoform X2 [Zootermopsis nevadensis]|uniref:probable ATP-dependent RNA helicase DDX56 isoform X2 n=1 Tax=Zootermopsis nevadensis TaxID=136037 RepID=UPI000B8E695A|nr:probable ATP-dependent RNA helicase DDX56 isoform X2 [Zootermopsis nevadensis]